MRNWRTAVIAVLTAAAIIGAGAPPATAATTTASGAAAASVSGVPAVRAVPGGVDDFRFESLAVDYTLGRERDGTSTLRVVETFVADFPDSDQNHGMRRAIPDANHGQPLRPHLVSITDGAGDPRPASVATAHGSYTMTSRSPGYLHGRQTFVFTYTLVHVTRTFADTGDDEFYWDVNGVDWPQQFGSVTATVHVAGDAASARNGRQSCYIGPQGSTRRCAITDDGGVLEASVGPVPPRQTMTIAIGFRKGTFVPFDTSPFASPWGWLTLVAALFGLVGAALAVRTRRRLLRDAPGRGTIIPEYTPPPGVDGLEGALLLAKQQKAVPAEILEQAIGGSIRLVETGRSLTGKPKLAAQLVDGSRADADGQLVLGALFERGPEFEFGKPDKRFASRASSITSSITKDLRARGYFAPVPRTARAWPIVLGVLGVAGAVGSFVAATASFVAPWPLGYALLVSGAAVVAIAALLSHRPLTARGVQAKEHLAGLRMFIEWAEEDRIRMLQSPQGAERAPVDAADPRQMLRLYETLLPYAVVFGQEKQWAKQLAVYSAAAGVAPVWYSGLNGGAFDADAFSAGVVALSAAAMSSSSTGGAGGGGSAGGGGGGGGGGGV